MLSTLDYDKLEQVRQVQKELLKEQEKTNKLLERLLQYIEYIKNTR